MLTASPFLSIAADFIRFHIDSIHHSSPFFTIDLEDMSQPLLYLHSTAPSSGAPN